MRNVEVLNVQGARVGWENSRVLFQDVSLEDPAAPRLFLLRRTAAQHRNTENVREVQN